jgi:hypothetical protein
VPSAEWYLGVFKFASAVLKGPLLFLSAQKNKQEYVHCLLFENDLEQSDVVAGLGVNGVGASMHPEQVPTYYCNNPSDLGY